MALVQCGWCIGVSRTCDKITGKPVLVGSMPKLVLSLQNLAGSHSLGHLLKGQDELNLRDRKFS